MLGRGPPRTEARTLARCAGCGAEDVRAFAEGDALFAESECGSCGGASRVEMIFSEEVPR